MNHRYTTQSLGPEHPCFVERTPGLADLERLFPSPSSSGRGRLAVEGGISIVAGPGMGKSSLLLHLARRLDRQRGIASARVVLPDTAGYPGEDGFYSFLGDLVRQLRTALGQSVRIAAPEYEAVAQVLASEPIWDAPVSGQGMSPRGMEGWIGALGAAAVHTPGLCILFDDIDHVATVSWKNAFVAGLRFMFQTVAGITPVYGLWRLFADESLPGSNYFRNVTRPFFLEPLGGTERPGTTVSERRALVNVDLSALTDEAAASLFRLAGGHPQLLNQLLGDLGDSISAAGTIASLTAQQVTATLDARGDVHRSLAGRLVAATPGLAAALREIARGAPATRAIPVGLLATGLVDVDAAGQASVPTRVLEVL